MIIYAILIPMAWLRLSLGSFDLSAAMVFVAIVGTYYFVLDFSIAIVVTAVVAGLLYLAEMTAALPFSQGMGLFLATFVGGWIIQLVGHAMEGRKPALVDNAFQIFVAPMFLGAEVYFLAGFKKPLKEKVLADIPQHL